MGPKTDKLILIELSTKLDTLVSTVENIEESLNDNTKAIKEHSESIARDFEDVDVLINSKFNSLQSDIYEMRRNIIDNLVKQNKLLSIEVEILKTKNDELEKCVQMSNQKCRENNIEIAGISDDISDDDLEATVVKILNKIDIKVTDRDLQDCHRLPGPRESKLPKKTIVKFVNKKDAKVSLTNRSKLSNEVNFEELGLPGDSKIFLDLNLNPYYKELAFHCRHLKRQSYFSMYSRC